MFEELRKLDVRPAPFSVYTAQQLWDDDHISRQMLAMHLDPDVEPASRRSAFIDTSVEWIVRHFDVGPGTRIADFGCGPGLYTTPFAQRGAEVTGIDWSRRSIAHARKTAERSRLKIDYTLTNYLTYESDKRFDLATLIYCDYCALSPTQRQHFLHVIRQHLAPGGRLLFDVFSQTAFASHQETATFGLNFMNHFWSKYEYIGFQRTWRYEAESVALDLYAIVTEEQVRLIYNWLQYFSLESIRSELMENGFTVVEQFADVTGQDYTSEATEIAIVAEAN